ncbi:MAG: glycosyltransferase family 2 protein [Solirubrobacteraceae bacterium]
MSGLLGVSWLVVGLAVAAPSLYLVVVAVAALRYRAEPPPGEPTARVVVLVPAHDEADLIARCVASLRAQRYPADAFEVVVVADNCTDDTAARAEQAGARVLVRDEPDARGKGRALRWAMDRVLSAADPPDAVVVVDADSVAEPSFLGVLVGRFEAGARAVQAESLLAEDGTQRTALRAAAFLLINRVRPAGRHVLGLPCSLCGNGMLLARELLEEHPWQAFSATEDLEYAIQLRRAGVAPVHGGGSILVSASAPSAAAQREQQLRWEGGKAHLARAFVPRLVMQALRERRLLLVDAAFELALPPLGLLAAAATGGLAAGVVLAIAGALPPAAVAPWCVAVLAIPAFVLIGLRAADAPPSGYRAMVQAPLLVANKVLHAYRLASFRGDSWVRTPRR